MPPPKPRAFCKALRRICRKCGKERGRGDTNQFCECGEDRTCNKPVVPNFTLCQNHGGPIPSRGMYGRDKFMSFPLVRLADKYRKMAGDARILSNRASIEVVRARIEQLAERIDFEDAPDRMEKIGDFWAEYMEAKYAGKTVDMIALEKKINREFEKARADYAAWSQMFEAIDLDRKLVEAEVKVVKEIRAFLTAEDAYELVAKLLAVVTDVVDDPKKLKAIQWKFTKLIGDKTNPPQQEPIDVDAEDVGEEV